MTDARRGRVWAYAGAVLGGVVSVGANVAHSYVPPADAPVGWSPQGGAVVGAVFWPVALFVAVEILARVAWPTGRRWVAVRYLGLLPVALVAAVVSYRHLSGLLVFYGEDALTAMIGPLAVDGLMIMATGALIATSGHTPVDTPGVPRALAWPPAEDDAGHGPGPAPDRPTDPLLPAASSLVAAAPRIGRRRLAALLREQGHAVGSERAGELLRTARTTAPNHRLNGHPPAREEDTST